MESPQVAQEETQAERWARYRTLVPELQDWQCQVIDNAMFYGKWPTWRVQ